jgi:hypothetical protein
MMEGNDGFEDVVRRTASAVGSARLRELFDTTNQYFSPSMCCMTAA